MYTIGYISKSKFDFLSCRDRFKHILCNVSLCRFPQVTNSLFSFVPYFSFPHVPMSPFSISPKHSIPLFHISLFPMFQCPLFLMSPFPQCPLFPHVLNVVGLLDRCLSGFFLNRLYKVLNFDEQSSLFRMCNIFLHLFETKC